jgi:hypothetical protein
MTPERLAEIARYFCDLFERYSVNPGVDRLDPAYRVGKSDITAKYPELSLPDFVDLDPYIKREMRRRGLSFRRARNSRKETL